MVSNSRYGGPSMIQAALNGDRVPSDHPAVPFSIDQLIRDAVACVAAGAGAIHLHPRNSDGRESLEPDVVNEVVTKVREACGVPVGVTTGEWIEPDFERRLSMIRGWTAPDYTSVNISEPGSTEVMQALIDVGVGIEAGVWCVEDVDQLAASGLGHKVLRVLVEPGELQVSDDAAVLSLIEEIHSALDRHGLTAPRLQHADGKVTWAALTDAIRRGLDTRVGLEDTLYGPDSKLTAGNAALVEAAAQIRVGIY